VSKASVAQAVKDRGAITRAKRVSMGDLPLEGSLSDQRASIGGGPSGGSSRVGEDGDRGQDKAQEPGGELGPGGDRSDGQHVFTRSGLLLPPTYQAPPGSAPGHERAALRPIGDQRNDRLDRLL
jgi:hypothetical protein